MKLTLLATLTLLSLVAAQCPSNYAIPNLVADSVQFTVTQPKTNSSQQYQYSISSPLPSVPSVAIALQDFSLFSCGPHDFYVAPTQISESAIVFTFAYTNPIWSKIRFNFWASANSQIQLGHFSSFNLANSGNSASVTTYLKSAFQAGDNPVVRAFINGYMSSSLNVQIAVAPSNLQGTTLTIKVMLGDNTSVKGVWLSYIAFTPSSGSFYAYGGSLTKSAFSGVFNQDASNSLYQTPYTLYGLTQISLSGQTPLDFSFSMSKDFQLAFSSSRVFDSFSIMYIVAGVLPSKLCLNCGDANIAYGNTCVKSCPLGTTKNTFKAGGIGCLGTALTGSASSTPASGSASGSSSSSTTTQTQTQTQDQTGECPKNSFFNGYQCVCQVGFGYINGACVVLRFSEPVTYIVNPSSGSSSSSTGSSSGKPTTTTIITTTTTTTASSAGSTSASTQTPTPTPTPIQAVPTQTPVSTSSSSVNCPANSYNNGLGTCVCKTGFYFDGTSCVGGTPCPSGSDRQADGTCKCQSGLNNYGGYCSRCPNGAIWSDQTKACIYVCGQNSVYDTSLGSCVCIAGFGLNNGQCAVCPNNYFIANGYCVTCPVNSFLNKTSNNCVCEQGFYTNQFGICTKKCGTNEVFDTSSNQCICLQGLGRINGACTVCPGGTALSPDGSCSNCGKNEQLVGGKCMCKDGFAYNSARVCTICSDLPNGFLINGICSVCPNNLIYNGNNGCACPQGKILQGSICVSQCQADELLDANGNCYTCGSNQIISNGKCVCTKGYALNSCGICVLSCSSGQFVFQGGCATCPLNTVYNAQINGCGCPDGYYKDTYGICSQLVLKPINCPDGQYFDSTHGCVTCPGSCRTCKSATQCLTCTTAGYAPNSQGTCVAKCGDGLIVGAETCDNGNVYSAGCVGCQIQPGYTCSGQPSVCVSNTPAPTTTPSAPSTNTNGGIKTTGESTPSNTAALYQSGKTTINSNNVFITLKTNPTFTFANPTDMQNFIQTVVNSAQKPTVYCSQRPSPNLDTFDCLMIYPSGVPNQNFSINFSYNYQSKTGSTTVQVDPFAVSNSNIIGSERAKR